MRQLMGGFPVLAQRLSSGFLSVFALIAVVLAAVGIFGVMSHAVAQRTREIGVRMALGARPRDVLGAVVGQGLRLTLLGLALGLVGSIALGRALRSLLYGVTPTDPATYAAVSLLLGGIALLACWVPARRATRVDPMQALRSE
jgi:ABC-type antimicrobial peptide transport system permease subunit